MQRLTRDQVADEIAEAAAALYARHGVGETSIQQVADATGYSKAGLLHYFPTKAALQAAVLGYLDRELSGIADAVDAEPAGPGRDRRALSLLLDLAVRRPGLVSLAMTALTSRASEDRHTLEAYGEKVDRMFGLAPPDAAGEREVRVVAAAGALMVGVLGLAERAHEPEVRATLLRAAVDALGSTT